MSVQQLSLDIAPPRKRTATVIDRRTGLPVPALRRQQALVLEAVVGRDGGNAWQVQEWLRARGLRAPETNAVGTRFKELADQGWLVQIEDRPGSTGQPQHSYTATAAGRERLVAWLATEGER